MLNVLYQVEKELPELLELKDWESLDVDYEQPRVERVWRPWNEYRVMLHRIHQCNEGAQPLLHPHPWPSAMRIVRGQYEMVVGSGWIRWHVRPAAKIILNEGDCYEMTNLDGWHSVRPTTKIIMSLMITGKPWSHAVQDVYSMPSRKSMSSLTGEAKMNILNCFRSYYS